MFAQTVHSVAATVGFTSWLLLWSALVLGLAVRNGWASTRVRHSTVHAVHMTLALLGLTLGVVHGAAQLAAPNGIVRLVDLAVPFVNPSDPVGVGAGALSLELLLAGALSVPLRKRLGHARWRAVHALTYGGVHPAHRARPHLRVRRGSDVAVGERARRLPGRGRPVARVDRSGGEGAGAPRVTVARPWPCADPRHRRRRRTLPALRVLRARGPRRVPPAGQRPPGLPGTRAGRRRRERDPCRRGVPRAGHRAAPAADHGAHADTGPIPRLTPAAGVPRTAEATLRTGGLPTVPVGTAADGSGGSRAYRTEHAAATRRRGRGR